MPTAALSAIAAALLALLLASPAPASASCGGCPAAYAAYYVTSNLNASYIAALFDQPQSQLQPVNPNVTNIDFILAGTYINVSFACGCLDAGHVLGHYFNYTVVKGDTYLSIAENVYNNLTTSDALQAANTYPVNNVPDGVSVRVPVNCSCGDAAVSKEYGLFVTYPLRAGDNLSSVAELFRFNDTGLLQKYNSGVDFTSGKGVVFVPTTDANGTYPPFPSSKGLSAGSIAGIIVAVVIVVLVLATCIYYQHYKRKKAKKTALLQSQYGDYSVQSGHELVAQPRTDSELGNFNMEKSVEFSYEELSMATDGFSIANKIGEGGFGAVYYAELRGEKAAIKKMDAESSNEFLAEIKVLTHVHHLNLVRLIGYCIKEALFLVYEYIDNGNLSQHLRGSGVDPLPWSVRVQIALDSARGLEYIHEHTVPVYIHRDIKSANILIDRNFRAKVADFGLTKLTEVGNVSLPTRLVGTFGYMPPEYAQYGDVSPKVDVFAFGVVLYELISAKEAIVKTGNAAESKGLVSLFDDALSQPDPVEHLKKLVDPNLGDSYPVDSVLKLAQLAKSCTEEEPGKRPTMRSVVVSLMALSSSTGDWDVVNFHGNQALVNLMSGR